MVLTGRNDAVELRVDGYEFPDIENDEWDSNWLNVRTSVEMERGTWSSLNPSLLTHDVSELADWLNGIAEGRDVDRELDFLDPNLAFELWEGGSYLVTLRVYFELESRPPWAPSALAGERDLWVDLVAPGRS